MKHPDLSFHPNLVLRTPGRPFNTRFDEQFIRDCLHDAQFLEALYLASPSLYEECLKWREGAPGNRKRSEKLLYALVKYYCRASSRCTPFGLFAGCSVVHWGEGQRARLGPAPHGRHTRLDMQYLGALTEYLTAQPELMEKLRYFPNSSIYRIGDEIRYVEYWYEQDVRRYQISSVSVSDYLLGVLAAAQAGLGINRLAGRLMALEAGLAEEECREFVLQMVQNQLLVSELEPSVTGKDFLAHVQEVLGRTAAEPGGETLTGIAALLGEVQAGLQSLDAAAVNPPARYEAIINRLEGLEVPLARNMLFQVDLAVAPDQPVLDGQLQAQLLEGLQALRVLAPRRANPQLEAFKTLFADRYGDREVPLLEALDTESGIGYSHHHAGAITTLVEDLVLDGEESEEPLIGQLETQRFISRKLIEAQQHGSYAVAIDPEELRLLTPPEEELPPSMAVLFRVPGPGRVLLEGITGSSAINLLGRFAHGDPAIEAVIGQVTRAEQRTNPDVVFAEVNHLPQRRIGNILARPRLREYEIPYLTHSLLPREAQISLHDLFISLQDNQIVLRSRPLNRVVVPRLGTAHNYAHESLPVYHFLCDLQTQGLQAGLHFSWEPVPPGVVFLPRVTYKNLVLHLATWHFSQRDLRSLFNGEAALPERFGAFRDAWRLPRLFTLADGDNELLVDADNPLTVLAWLETIRHYDTVRLREFLFEPEASPVTDAQDRPYVNQFIALLVNGQKGYAGGTKNPAYAGAAQTRKFWFGSEWLYYKLYCGVKSSDRILLEAIAPLSEALHDQGLIDKWFFIRYADPNPHLRVRFHLPDVGRIGAVVQLVNEYLAPYLEKDLIWKSQVDTYVRELERYGYQATEMSETLFHCDSLAALAILGQTAADEQADTRWLWGIRSADQLLDAFGYDLAGKQALIGRMKEAFAREFGMNKPLKLQLDGKYRGNKALLRQFLDPEDAFTRAHPDLFAHLHRRDAYAATLAGRLDGDGPQQLGVDRDQLVSSHVHMLLNRLIPASQRLHEMVIYDFLYRQYQAQAAMQRK